MSSQHSLPSDMQLLDAVSSLNASQTAVQTSTATPIATALPEHSELRCQFRLKESVEVLHDAFELEPDPINHYSDEQDQIELFLPDPDQDASNEAQMELGGMPRPVFNIFIDGSDQLVEFYNANSLLESMEQQGIPMSYQCREGYCGACRTQLLKGRVQYLREPMAWLNQGEVLPCCCIPLSDVQIKVTG